VAGSRAVDAADPPLHDAAELARLTGGDRALSRDLLAAFAAGLADERTAIRSALDAGAALAVQRALHRLLGACRSACVPRLAIQVRGLEDRARHGDIAGVAMAWPDCVALIDATAAALTPFLTESPAP
jgi:HPt (histidine-containing phosphotransfer) domain-containing protein